MSNFNLTLEKRMIGFAHIAVCSIFVFGLSACNTTEMFTKKDNNEVSSVLPDKIERLKQKEKELQAIIFDADTALANGEFILAIQRYNEALKLDKYNLRAKEGLHRATLFKKHSAKIVQAKALINKKDGETQAANLLRSVLIENPNNVEAENLYQIIIDRISASRIQAMQKKLSYKNHVSLEFRDTAIKVIIEALAKGTGVNFILDKDVKSTLKASLFVRNVPLEKAIDMLVESNQLKKKVLSDNSVLIYPDTPLKLRQYTDLIIRSFYLEYADPVSVSNSLKTLLNMKQIQTDDRLPIITIKDIPEVMVLAEKLIKSQDVAEPEVMLEMNIFEVRRSAVTDKGVTWPTQLSVISEGALTLTALKGLSSRDIGVSPNPALIFDGQDANVNLLANPRIRVKNKTKAKIHIGDRVPIITSNVSSNGVISDNVQYIDTGLKLEVEPEISIGGDVTIKLNLDVSSIGEKTVTNTGAVVPQIGTRSTSTELRLKDGETQILAGLINDEERNSVNKIPGLGDIPILGHLFSNHKNDKVKTELVLTITPRIIRLRQSPDVTSAKYWMGTELQVGRGFGGGEKYSRKELSKLFRAGTPPQATNTKKPAQANNQGAKPQGLNIQLPSSLKSSF